MSTRQDYIEAIDGMVHGENFPLGVTDKRRAIAKAIKEHSRHNPRELAQDITGDGGFEYDLTDLTYWSEGFSVIKSVEYEVDDDDETPDVLLEQEWMIYRKPAGRVLRFLEDTPDTDETFRVTYTAPHTCTDSACTVNDFDEEAVQTLAAAYFCEMLATAYAKTNDSTISADSVNHKTRSQEYAARAKAYRKEYFDHFGITEGEVPPASVTFDWDANTSWGSDSHTHPRKWR